MFPPENNDNRYSLGPERRRPLAGCPGFYVRISDDIRKTVVFFGFEDGSPGKGGINCVGTGFLLNYDDCGYLVTAKHLAHELGDQPFLVRINKSDGTSENAPADNVRWYELPDPTIDVAVIPFGASGKHYDARYLPQSMMALDALVYHDAINFLGTGDLTYTVGLFRLMSGETRNLPVVHSGSIAMMPRDEKIPVRDWRDKDKRLFVEGYLIESHGMPGLSGSPVFVRSTVEFSYAPQNMLLDPRSIDPRELLAVAPRETVFLLGLWSSSWDAPPGEVLAIQAGAGNRVPVGMGIVVSAQKIEETLMMPELQEMRKQQKAERERQLAEEAASPDSAIPMARPTVGPAAIDALPATDANPNHLTDFTRLVDVAARKRPQGGQT